MGDYHLLILINWKSCSQPTSVMVLDNDSHSPRGTELHFPHFPLKGGRQSHSLDCFGRLQRAKNVGWLMAQEARWWVFWAGSTFCSRVFDMLLSTPKQQGYTTFVIKETRGLLANFHSFYPVISRDISIHFPCSPGDAAESCPINLLPHTSERAVGELSSTLCAFMGNPTGDFWTLGQLHPMTCFLVWLHKFP